MLTIYFLTYLLCTLTTLIAARPQPHAKAGFVETIAENYEPIHWLTHFGGVLPADTTINLEWEGGSGKGYEVYYIPQWDGQDQYYPTDIVTTTATHYEWRTPKASAYPDGTTFIVGINDMNSPSFGSEWYDLTGLLEFDK